jgi:hypothetical protein
MINLKLFSIDWIHTIRIQNLLRISTSKFRWTKKKKKHLISIFVFIENKIFFKNFMDVKVIKYGRKLKNISIVFLMNHQLVNKALRMESSSITFSYSNILFSRFVLFFLHSFSADVGFFFPFIKIHVLIMVLY